MKQVRKAIIAAAGSGTRFLPQTKAMPKEMLPIIDRPVIQMVVEEAVAAGVTDIIIVTGQAKRALEDHFDRATELENDLRAKGKNELADELQRIAEMANIVYVRQKGEPKGNARPVLNAAHLIDDEPFFVFFGDDFFTGEVPRAKQLLDTYNRTGKSVISLIEVPKSDADKYGMAVVTKQLSDGTFQIGQLVEKPGEADTPSQYASIGGYLLTPDILPIIAKQRVGKNGEITLADSINELAQQTEVYGQFIQGTFHDTGSPETYLKTIVQVALAHPEFGPEFKDFLKGLSD